MGRGVLGLLVLGVKRLFDLVIHDDTWLLLSILGRFVGTEFCILGEVGMGMEMEMALIFLGKGVFVQVFLWPGVYIES